MCEFQLVSSFADGKAKRRRLVCIVNARYVKEAALNPVFFLIFFFMDQNKVTIVPLSRCTV